MNDSNPLKSHLSGDSEKHKVIERSTFERMYDRGETNSNPTLRSRFLADSEKAFDKRLIEVSQEARLLEIGCGVGLHSIMAAKAGAHVTGIDFSPTAIDIAKQNAQKVGVAKNITFLVMDAENLEFNENSFDVVLNHETFSSIELQRVLAGCHRVLAPGGQLLGKECLGHNMFFNLNRSIGVAIGRRTKWAASHILKLEDVEEMRHLFRFVKVQFFHLLSPFASPLQLLPSCKLKCSLIDFVNSTDKALLRTQRLQKNAFKVIFELSEPLGK